MCDAYLVCVCVCVCDSAIFFASLVNSALSLNVFVTTTDVRHSAYTRLTRLAFSHFLFPFQLIQFFCNFNSNAVHCNFLSIASVFGSMSFRTHNCKSYIVVHTHTVSRDMVLSHAHIKRTYRYICFNMELDLFPFHSPYTPQRL